LEERVVDGLRIPARIDSHAAIAAILMQTPGKMSVRAARELKQKEQQRV
jgi:hypothetical protein